MFKRASIDDDNDEIIDITERVAPYGEAGPTPDRRQQLVVADTEVEYRGDDPPVPRHLVRTYAPQHMGR